MLRNRLSNVNLQVESLDAREMMSVSSIYFSGSTLVVAANNLATSVEVHTSGANTVVQEVGTANSWSYSSASVGRVMFLGGSANDRFVNNISTLPTTAYGYGGNDYLEGYNGADYFSGGIGNDTLVGYGGNDSLYGGTGNDVIRGMNGNDVLVGEDGNDRLNGGDGTDSMWGGNGDDILIALDNATTDFTQGDAGRDTTWVDRDVSFLGLIVRNDTVSGNTTLDKVQYVQNFANGADRTLNGDRITDPTTTGGAVYKTFSNNPLFSDSGPRMSDIRQGSLGDCWVLAGFGAIANDNPHVLRQNIVDFDDGTYGVRLGNSFYRVDNDLAVSSIYSTSPTYASLGAQNSMWVAIAEKAYAHYRTGANSFASIEGGWSVDVNRAFGSTSAGERSISSYGSATALANDIFARWNGYQAVTVGFAGGSIAAGAPLINSHMYTVASVQRNAAGVVTSITLRNPWGYDGAGSDSNTSDALVTVTPAQLFGSTGRVNWGAV